MLKKKKKKKKKKKILPKKYGNKKISAMFSAYWMNVAKSYGDLFYTPKSLPINKILSENSLILVNKFR